ncbi:MULTISPECIES: sterol desaturase family protein [Asticcacaulis]|uniref:sterol desaturase family protein n=1 Tax=Asticcacaulis TaxID=76890 RepID=UPI001AE7346D|nr:MULTISPECIES: sterol desaturase family protein [Asticcacaulis]MBP2159956.1 sterol desaturase/sphingolipid hydroxylase (fatty acid hydroxylase superfamily) [Asticcacaulis solisilvae]MDR6801001.1 sterol desaturase/sphingolipid hydroxylase (fatty acid hydroxylase superfamily) [Asticcacaulis sp. BE141]
MLSKLRLAIRNDLEAEAEQRTFGSGWLSGVLALVLGGSALLMLLAHHYPAWFSVEDLKRVHDSPFYMVGVQAMAFVAFGLACLNLTLRRNKILGFSAIALVLLTMTLGAIGAQTIPGEGIGFGVDWFVLNLLMKGLLFVPLEKLFSGNKPQPLFRYEWREDLLYFLISSLLIQIMAFISLAPSLAVLEHAALWQPLRDAVASQPYVVQFIELMLIADLMQYGFHRLFHSVPFLWRFHAVHHSAQAMDWMAGSRMHLFEILALRGVTIIPLYALGFEENALYGYIFFIYLVSAFVHANIRFDDRWIAPFIVTPRFHHWHHGIEKEAIDVNFAVHFPWIDRLFGTYYLPDDKWPSGYGIGGHPVPKGWLEQFAYPFRRGKPNPPAS